MLALVALLALPFAAQSNEIRFDVRELSGKGGTALPVTLFGWLFGSATKGIVLVAANAPVLIVV